MHKFLNSKFKNKQLDSLLSNNIETYPDTIDLSIGDPDIDTDSKVIELTMEDAKKGYTHYTKTSGMDELKEEIIRFQKEEYQISVDKSEIMVTSSASHAMYLILSACLNQGEEVILFEPCFMVYPDQINACGGKPVYVTLRSEYGFQINEEDLEASITSKTKAMIVNTPNNPTGVCLNRQSYEILTRIAKKHDILIIADDIYTIYSFGEPFTPIASLEGMRDYVVTIRSFSKNYAMTGWRLGYIIAPVEIIFACVEINDYVIYAPNAVSQRAAIHAIRLRKSFQPSYIERYKERLTLAYQLALEVPYFKVIEPKGSFYMFLDISQSKLNSRDFCTYIYEKIHIRALPGILFGPSFDGYIRVCATINLDKLKEAFERFKTLKF